MPDLLDELAKDVQAIAIDAAVRVALIHHVSAHHAGFTIQPGSYHDGYNTAVRDIAAKIRELKTPRT